MAKRPEEIECLSLLIFVSFIGEKGMEAEVGSPELAPVAHQRPAEVHLQGIICWARLCVDKREEREDGLPGWVAGRPASGADQSQEYQKTQAD